MNHTGIMSYGETMVGKNNKIDLRAIFMKLQEQMISKLSTDGLAISHPTAKGDASELNWIDMLDKYLPKRYKVDKAFVLDFEGSLSEQIDVVVYDRHYSPFLFDQDGTKYIPSESVYAVFEVKQDLNKEAIEYAGRKAESVRRLKRTSVTIPHAGGKFRPKEPPEIIAGILTLGSSWRMPFAGKLKNTCSKLNGWQEINLGCSLQCGAFEADYGEIFKVKTSKSQDSLIFFFIRLLGRLQAVGTIPAIDISEYGRVLD